MQQLLIGSTLESLAQLVTLIVIFALVLAITYFATRWVGGIQKEKMIGSNVKVLETMRISNSNEEELIYRENSTGGIHVDNFKAILDKYKKDKPED